MQSQENQIALPLRAHTILGVCEAIGEDFGINPMFLRVPLAASVLYSPLWAAVAYLGLGLIVLASRLLFPAPKREKLQPAMSTAAAEENHEYAKAA